MKVKKFNEYEPINEEFIGGLIKGALGKLAGLFSAPFKDLANDFKKMFKEDDPNSLKSVIMTNVNQAIDGAQKEIQNIKDETALLGVMDNMVNSLVQLANNIGKDVDTAFGKDKSEPIKELSKALLLGNKQADWVGLIGLIDPDKGILKKNINYKFSKKNYVDSVNKGKDLKGKQSAANKFLDDMQKNIEGELDKDLTEEELKKIYDEAKKKSGTETGLTYDQLKEFFDKKTPVIYLLKDKKKEDWNKLTDEQKKEPKEKPANTIVGVNVISSLNDQNVGDSVRFKLESGGEAKKSYSEIIGPAETGGDNAKKAAEALGKIKQDEEKMAKVAKFAEFMQDDKNKDKVTEIEKMMGA